MCWQLELEIRISGDLAERLVEGLDGVLADGLMGRVGSPDSESKQLG